MHQAAVKRADQRPCSNYLAEASCGAYLYFFEDVIIRCEYLAYQEDGHPKVKVKQPTMASDT